MSTTPTLMEPITAHAIPAFNITSTGVQHGNAESSPFLPDSVPSPPHISLTASIRSFIPIKVLGDGSFATVWLCDWHGALPPNTPMSTMQSVVGSPPEYANTRLVAVKRMKKKWEGGWDECRMFKELEVRVHPLSSLLRPSLIIVGSLRKSGITCDTPSSKHHTPVRLFSSSGDQGTLLCVRADGGAFVPVHQVPPRSSPLCKWSRRIHFPTDHPGLTSHPCFWLLSSGHET